MLQIEKANFKEFLSELHALFQQCSEKETLKFDQVSHF